MMTGRFCNQILRRTLLTGACVGLGAYAAYVVTTWARYGNPRRARDVDEFDTDLDRLMPRYDVVERHHVAVNAPASVTFDCACAMDLGRTPLVRAIFAARELVMGSGHEPLPPSKGLVKDLCALGWGVLAEVPGRGLVIGGVTQPWEPHPVFRAVPPAEFQAFAEPGFVKIAFTLRADPAGDARSVFRTETRALATDDNARRKFRAYWALLSPGIIAIRWSMLRPLKAEAERRVRSGKAHGAEAPSPA